MTSVFRGLAFFFFFMHSRLSETFRKSLADVEKSILGRRWSKKFVHVVPIYDGHTPRC